MDSLEASSSPLSKSTSPRPGRNRSSSNATIPQARKQSSGLLTKWPFFTPGGPDGSTSTDASSQKESLALASAVAAHTQGRQRASSLRKNVLNSVGGKRAKARHSRSSEFENGILELVGEIAVSERGNGIFARSQSRDTTLDDDHNNVNTTGSEQLLGSPPSSHNSRRYSTNPTRRLSKDTLPTYAEEDEDQDQDQGLPTDPTDGPEAHYPPSIPSTRSTTRSSTTFPDDPRARLTPSPPSHSSDSSRTSPVRRIRNRFLSPLVTTSLAQAPSSSIAPSSAISAAPSSLLAHTEASLDALGLPADGDSYAHDYTVTTFYGWIILVTTWIVFVVVMGSCLGVWSWAWDVGRTPYAPPELSDDPTLPINGYYPALMVCTAVMSWVWVTVAWVGMKVFVHASMEDGA